MIILSEVAQKLEEILNGIESPSLGNTNPTPFYFQVEAEGFQIDHIKKGDTTGNFIPVFVSSLGGQFNPVKGLKQGSYSYQINFYYPVRFKNEFFALGEFLVDTFVGTIINYGTISGKAVSNISVPQYGEIQSLDFDQFEKWMSAIYQKAVNKREAYMSMQVNLYLSNAADGLIYGNDVKTDLSFVYNGSTYTLEDIDVDGASLQSNSQTQSEQEEGTAEADAILFGTSYGAGIKIYPNLKVLAKESTENNPIYFYKELLKAWFSGDVQEIEGEITYTFAGDSSLKWSRKCYIQSAVAPIEKGQLFYLTVNFVKRTEETVVQTRGGLNLANGQPKKDLLSVEDEDEEEVR